MSEADQKEFLEFRDDSGDPDNDNDESAAMAVVGHKLRSQQQRKQEQLQNNLRRQ